MRSITAVFGVPMGIVLGGALLWTLAGVRAAPAEATPNPMADATYVGEKKCKKCHLQQHKTWKKMKHSETWELLAEKYRNDEAKDENGGLCVSCHTTGYGKPGGPATAAEAVEMNLTGTQCEACHGPGSNHIDLANKHSDADEIPDEVRNAIHKVPQNACIGCHNPHVSHEQYKEG